MYTAEKKSTDNIPRLKNLHYFQWRLQ